MIRTPSCRLFLLLPMGCAPSDDPGDTSSEPTEDPGPSTSPDADDDGFTVDGGDCDDADPTVFPGAPDVACNGLVEDCDAPFRADDAVLLDGTARPDLSAALQAAMSGQTVTLCPGDHDSTGATLPNGVTLRGRPDLKRPTLRPLQGSALTIVEDAHVTLSGLSLAGGDGTPHPRGGTAGGGLFVEAGATVEATALEVVGHTAQWGAGIHLGPDATLELSDGHVHGNRQPPATLGGGGGLYLSEGATATLRGGSVHDNDATPGGAAWLETGAQLLGEDGPVLSGVLEGTDQHSSGVYAEGDNVIAGLQLRSFDSDTPDEGGAVHATDLTLSDCEIEDNTAATGGAGVRFSGSAHISDTVFRRNDASAHGADIADGDGSTPLTLERVTSEDSGGHEAFGAGSSLLLLHAGVTCTDCTFVDPLGGPLTFVTPDETLTCPQVPTTFTLSAPIPACP